MKPVRTRFAPSPTGYLHIGGIRTALFSWLYARHHSGSFILRIEDTDRERSTEEAIGIIIDGMQWLGLETDEGPYYQSKHTDRYRQVIQQLLDTGNAYYCYCSKEELDEMRAEAMSRGEKPRYNGRCRHRDGPPAEYHSRVVRFKTPESGKVTVHDIIQGDVVFNNSELDDLIIARSDGVPTYNLTVVVDDMDMEISHVIRGDDHLNNTPRQINIFSALGAELPLYAHIPLILNEDGKKLSKRHGAASVLSYRDMGILPEALLNYLVRLGWSHGDQEIFSIEELISLFDLKHINRSAAAINPEKLIWLNQHYLKNANSGDLAPHVEEHMQKMSINIGNGPDLKLLCDVQKERVKTLEELAMESKFFYEDFEHYEEHAAKKHLRPVIQEPLKRIRDALEKLNEWTAEGIHNVIENVASEMDMKLGKVAQPLRVAVTGTGISPSIDKTLLLVGRERAIKRLDKALEYIKTRTQLDTGQSVT